MTKVRQKLQISHFDVIRALRFFAPEAHFMRTLRQATTNLAVSQ